MAAGLESAGANAVGAEQFGDSLGLGGFGASWAGEGERPWVDAPASIRTRTVAIQSGCGLVFGRNPLPMTAHSRAGLPPTARPAHLGASALAVEQEPDHGGASGESGGVQRGGSAVVAADVDGEVRGPA